MGFLLRVLVNAVTIALAAHVVPGIILDGVVPALIAGVVLGIVNAVVRPFLLLLSLPALLFTLGLFLLVINAAMLGLVAAFLPGFSISSFWAAFLAAILVSLVSWIGAALFKKDQA